MRLSIALLELTGVSLLYAQAQPPLIRANSVVNAASQIPPGLPNYGIAGIVPSTTPAGDGTITVTLNGRTSAPAPITIVPSAFGIFTLNQLRAGPCVFTPPDLAVNLGVAQHLIGPFPPDTTFGGNSLVAAAHPGDQLVIWGTGMGPPWMDPSRCM